jgi:phosphohistidine phosphatase
MAKKLVLIRHAKSDWNVGVDDYNRPLNERGRKDAPNMGKHLKSINLLPDKIVSSSAERAISTARLVANGLRFPLQEIIETKELYHASPKTILKQASLIENDVSTLFIVGHNPGISDFLSYLVDEDYELKTCCVAVLELKVVEWSALFQGTCILKQYISPREI